MTHVLQFFILWLRLRPKVKIAPTVQHWRKVKVVKGVLARHPISDKKNKPAAKHLNSFHREQTYTLGHRELKLILVLYE